MWPETYHQPPLLSILLHRLHHRQKRPTCALAHPSRPTLVIGTVHPSAA